MGPVLRYYYIQNNASVFVVANIEDATLFDGATISVSPPIAPGRSARVDLSPLSPKDELHSLTLSVTAQSNTTTSASAGSFFIYEPSSNFTVYTAAGGDANGLSLAFNGFGPDPAPSQ